MSADAAFNLLPLRARWVRRRRRAIVCEWAIAALIGAVLSTAHGWGQHAANDNASASTRTGQASGASGASGASVASGVSGVPERSVQSVGSASAREGAEPPAGPGSTLMTRVLEAVADAAAAGPGVVLDGLTIEGTRVALGGRAKDTRRIAQWLDMLHNGLRDVPVSLDAIERRASYVKFAAHADVRAGGAHD